MISQEKIIFFAKRLKEEHIIYFRLYNALYKITLSNHKLVIRQEGMDISYTYSSLKELFENYIVYGYSLLESIDDIKMV